MSDSSWMPKRGGVRPLIVVAALALVVPSDRTSAQSTTGAPVFDFPLSVRSVGMGQSGTADRFTPGNVFFNPANVIAVDGVYSTGSYELPATGVSPDITLGHLSLGFGRELQREKPVVLGLDLTITRLSYGTSIAVDTQGRPIGEYDSWERYVAVTAGVSVAASANTNVAFGLGYKRFWAEYAPDSFSSDPDPQSVDGAGNLFDIGVIVSTEIDASGWRARPAAGIAMVNQGADIDFGDDTEPVPTWFNYGVTMRIDSPDVRLGSADVPTMSATLNFDGKHGLNDQRPLWSIGAEFTALQLVFIRWGQSFDDFYHYGWTTWGAGMGLAVGSARARIEYSNTGVLPYYYTVGVDQFGFTFVWLFD